MLGSQGLVLATAMVVSSTVLFLTFSRQKITSPPTKYSGNHDSEQPSEKTKIPRPCLSSGEKKKSERKKKKVKFAENVKEPTGNGEEFRNQHKKRSRVEMNCRNEIPGIQRMPPNRVALYNGILKDRVHRTECSSY
ncbi:cytochrome P450 family protein [Trema orientale]|uniref:Cytochrome P450 family protein n=1 Tax=Trema orientale TaxID=63057 RepID=A0A2P5EX44_TREOI|nr:cytochrome P450 family protein [Trema orientale]